MKILVEIIIPKDNRYFKVLLLVNWWSCIEAREIGLGCLHTIPSVEPFIDTKGYMPLEVEGIIKGISHIAAEAKVAMLVDFAASFWILRTQLLWKFITAYSTDIWNWSQSFKYISSAIDTVSRTHCCLFPPHPPSVLLWAWAGE